MSSGAHAEVFLFFMGLLQRFCFEPGVDRALMEIGSVHGLTRSVLSKDPIAVMRVAQEKYEERTSV